MGIKVRLNEVVDSYGELAKKYSLPEKDIELIFIESLVMYFNNENIEILSEGILVDGKYKNIRHHEFSKIITYFNQECNRRSFKKLESYVDTLLLQNDYIIYAKILEKTDYYYIVQPMISKTQTLRYINPIKIERDGPKIPDRVNLLPIEIRPSTKSVRKNSLDFKAKIFSKNLAKTHIKRLVKRLEENHNVFVRLRVRNYYDGKLQLKDMGSERNMHYKIVNFISNYFKEFNISVYIDTNMQRKDK